MIRWPFRRRPHSVTRDHPVGPESEFRPLPFLGNAHVQTLLGHCIAGPAFAYPSREHHVPLPDGDGLALHDSVPPGWRPGDRIALLLHGLGGCHRSPHLQRTARLLLPRGIRVVRMDLRGAGAGARLARRPYHAGCSDDARAALLAIHSWSPPSPVVLVGFSLSGNIALKLAAEAGHDPVPGLAAVAALAPPIDLQGCSDRLALRRNRFYHDFFLRCMLRQFRHLERLHPDLPPVPLPRRMTIRLFDELVTARRWGFADAADFYGRCSSAALIPHIRVPTLVLTARDDPFIDREPFERLTVPAHVDVRILERGGHLGFLGWDGAGGIHWINRHVADWVSRTP